MKEGLTKPGAHNLVLVCVHLVSIEWDTVKFLISMSPKFSSDFDIKRPTLCPRYFTMVLPIYYVK